MWNKLATIILRYRILLLSLVTLFTVFMAYNAQFIKLGYNYAALLPKDDPFYVEYQEFKKVFGEDGSVMIVGMEDPNFFQKDKFNDWIALSDSIKNMEGIGQMTSISGAYALVKNSTSKKFELKPIFPKTLQTQNELDSLNKELLGLPFYKNLLYNEETHVFLIAASIDSAILNTKGREAIIDDIEHASIRFADKYGLKAHFSGLPYTRTRIMQLVEDELFMFIFMALMVSAFILYLFFRSFKVVIFSMLIVSIGVIWAMGSINLFDYKITVLTGMIPPLIIVIGIPNSVYLLNKYHSEYVKHGNQTKALQRVITKVGTATFLTNLTTALGFATFLVTGNSFLMEFGIIASINIMGVFVLSILLIPIFFSFLSAPKRRHIKHLEYKSVNLILSKFSIITQNHRKAVYVSVLILIMLSIYGTSLMENEGYIVDDIPHDDPVYVDLKFFEKHIKGVLPFEIAIDTKKNKGIYKLSTLKRIEQLQLRLAKFKELSGTSSIVDVLKFARQAYYNGKPEHYKLPSNEEMSFIAKYIPKMNSPEGTNLISRFVDSRSQITRLSFRIKDIGTLQTKQITDSIRGIVNEIFPTEQYNVSVTGSSIIFTQGTTHLINNLTSSLALAIVLIAVFMAIMFRSVRMVFISVVPNLLPLLLTAGIMGFFNIAIKPSTVLVFSIAFGISVDNAIHFLAKYKQELASTNQDVQKSVDFALRETGVSIIYTAFILFFGFAIFIASKFGGTQALGLLVSITLMVAMFGNLLLLPSLLISFAPEKKS